MMGVAPTGIRGHIRQEVHAGMRIGGLAMLSLRYLGAKGTSMLD